MARQSKRELAYSEYKKGVSNKEIAHLLGVTAVTVSNWKKEDNWEERSLAEKTEDSKILAKIRNALSKELDNEIIDDLRVMRLSKSVKELTKDEIEAAKAMTVIKHLMKFCQDAGEIETAKGIAKVAPTFIDYVLEREI